MRYTLLLISLLLCKFASSQTWLDSLDLFARERIDPPALFAPSWQNAPLLHAMEMQYELASEAEKPKYVDYVKRSLDRNLTVLNGIFPNSVSSGNGVAFLYRVTGDPKYLNVANRIYSQYLNILRTSNGGVSHLPWTPELWDDTVYMIGVFLLSMYRATGDIDYVLELIDQVWKHREKLIVDEWGLWVHGWDGDNVYNFDFCSQPNWADPVTRRSAEIWGRGNGWVILTLSEILNNLPQDHPEWENMAELLKEMIINLPDLQDESTGHWYQLTVRKGDPGNYIESSSTAMFGYGILTALKYGIVSGEAFENAVKRVYHGLKAHSVALVGDNTKPYLNTRNVAKETCLGDKNYYYNIGTGGGKAYASGVYIIFGRAYDELFGSITGINNPSRNPYTIEVNPTLARKSSELQVKVVVPRQETVEFILIDILGRSVQRQSQALSAGENRNRFSLDGVPGGHYIFLVKNQQAEIVTSRPIIIQ